MTRQEWIDRIDDLDTLISWCWENSECESVFEDVISDETLDEYVQNDIYEYDYSWRELRDDLDGIPTGYDWYRVDGRFDYVGLSDDFYFEDYKTEVLNELDSEGYFDDEEEEEEEEGPFIPDQPVDRPVTPDEPEIDEVDLEAFGSMSSVIWGITCDAVEPQQDEPEQRMEEQDTSVHEIDLGVLPF